MSALSKVHSVAITGVDGAVVEIEGCIGPGLPAVHLVGLPDTVLKESRDRIRAAIVNIGIRFPDTRVTVALSPATLPKVGSVYDLPCTQLARFLRRAEAPDTARSVALST